MRKIFFACFLILTASAGFAGTRFEYEWVGFSAPQSVCAFGRYLFISNLGNGDKNNPDGYISKLTDQGEIVDKYWISGLTAPRGMGVMNNRLYVADAGFVRGFNLLTRKEEFTLEMPETEKLIDIESLRDGVSFAVTDSKNGLIYRVYFNGDFYPLILEPIEGVSGLYFKSRKLYFCTEGSDKDRPVSRVGYLKIRVSRNEVIPYFIGTAEGRFRGIAVEDNSIFVTDRGSSERPGRIFCFDADENMMYPIWDRDLNLPGDFLMDGDDVLVPTEGDGKIKYISDIH